jgi:Transglycosylase-like domain
MSPSRTIVALGSTAVLAAPAASAAADAPAPPLRLVGQEALAPTLPGQRTVVLEMRQHGRHQRLVRRYVHELHRADRRPVHHPDRRSDAQLHRAIHAARQARRARRARERARVQPVAAVAAASAGPTGALAAIAQCESGGDPHAVGGGGTYRGLYQFSAATWQAVGGSGDPVAASVGEQTRRAELLYAQAGPAQWPVCGR